MRKNKPRGHFRMLLSRLMEKYTLIQIVAKADIYFPEKKKAKLPPGTVLYKEDGHLVVAHNNVLIVRTMSEIDALIAACLSIQTFGQYIVDAAKILKALVYPPRKV